MQRWAHKRQKWYGPERREDIKKWWQDTQRNYAKKDLNDLDNHNGVIAHLEPDILECEVKQALGSITTNKAIRGDGIPAELFKIQKTILWKCCTQYVSKFGKLSSGHRTGKGQFSFQSQRRVMPKNVQTTKQFHSFHTLARLCSNSSSQATAVCEPRTSRCISWVLKRQRNQGSNCQYTMDHGESKGIPEKHQILFHWLC